MITIHKLFMPHGPRYESFQFHVYNIENMIICMK
jgi:hypothetical protein